MKLSQAVGSHVSVHTEAGPVTGILLHISEGAGPQYITLNVTPKAEEPKIEIIPWHEIKRIHPYAPADEEILRELEKLEV